MSNYLQPKKIPSCEGDKSLTESKINSPNDVLNETKNYLGVPYIQASVSNS